MKMIGTLLIALTATAFLPAPSGGRQLLPHDAAAETEDLVAARTAILDALDRNDYNAVASYASPEVQAYYDAVPGREELIRCLRDEGLAKRMTKALKAGGRFYDDGGTGQRGFIAPSLFIDFPEDLDPYENAVVYGEDVNIRSQPDVKSKVVTQLTYHIVGFPEWNPKPCKSGSGHQWHRVRLPSGEYGYLAEDYLWTTGSERFHFMKVDGKWRLEFVMTGA